MAYHDDRPTDRDRIPAKPSPRSPPPPRALEQPQPVHTKHKLMTRKAINKSQLRTAVVMIVLVIILTIIIIVASMPYGDPYDRTMERDVSVYSFEFNVPDILSQDMPISIDVTSSDQLEFYLLKEERYFDDINISELKTYSLNRDHTKTTNFIYEADLEPGRYVVVAYQQFDKDHDILLTYDINWYLPIFIIWIVCLIFILLFVVCIVRIGLLQRKKSKVHEEAYPPSAHDYDYAHPGGTGTTSGYDHHDPHTYGERATGSTSGYPPPSAPHQQPPQQPRPRSTYDAPPRPRPPRRTPQAPPPMQYSRTQDQPPPAPREYQENQEPVTVPCKCGELIVITDTLRPLRIQCPRCGRRGILEGKKKEPEDDIFY